MQHSWGEIQSLNRMLVGKQRSKCEWLEGAKVGHKEVLLLYTR
jgi:hypothetical protein